MSDSFDFDGRVVLFDAGQSSPPFLAAGVAVVAHDPSRGPAEACSVASASRFDCLVTVDDRPNQRACLVPARARLDVRSQ